MNVPCIGDDCGKGGEAGVEKDKILTAPLSDHLC